MSNSSFVTWSARETSSKPGVPSRRPTRRTPSARPSGQVSAGEPLRTSAGKRTGEARSETKKPLTFSAGHVAHQPTTPTFSPFALATFQMAGTFRDQPEIGSRARVFGSSSWKSAMPWSTGDRPVASVVQMSGEIIGFTVSRFQVRPRATSPERFGRRPRFMSGSRSFQSPPSQPTTKSGAGRAGFPPPFAGADVAGGETRRRAAISAEGRHGGVGMKKGETRRPPPNDTGTGSELEADAGPQFEDAGIGAPAHQPVVRVAAVRVRDSRAVRQGPGAGRGSRVVRRRDRAVLVQADGCLVVQQVVPLRHQRHGHAAELDRIGSREVDLEGPGVGPHGPARHNLVPLGAVPAVEVAVFADRRAGPQIRAEADGQAERRRVGPVQTELMPVVEGQVSVCVRQEERVVVVGVDAGVRLAPTRFGKLVDAGLAVVVAVKVRPEVAELGPELVGDLILHDELDAMVLALGGRNRDVRRLGAGAIRPRRGSANVIAPVAGVEALPRREDAAGPGVDDGAGVRVSLWIRRVEVAPVLDRPAEVPVVVADGDGK